MGACMMSNNQLTGSTNTRELDPNSRAMIREEIQIQTSTFSFHNTACFAKFSLNSLGHQSDISSFSLTDENSIHSLSSEGQKQHDTVTFKIAPQIITLEAQQLESKRPVELKKTEKNWSIEEIYHIKDLQAIDNIFSQDQKDIVMERIDASLPVKLPNIIFKDGSSYQGEWLRAKRHGKGVFESPLIHYYGLWADDKMQGNGTLIFSNKDKYDGEFREGMMHGKGRYQQARGTVYEGEFVANKKEGEGIEVYEINQYYKGQWKNGYKHGQGFLQFSDGSYCKGNFQENFINGFAEYKWFGQKKFIGNWVLNKMEGAGVMEWDDGRRYEGNYKNDKMQGFGTYQYTNGEKYVGQWKNNKKYGRGQFLLQNGQLMSGIWYEDRLIERFAERPKKRHAITSTSGKSLTSTR